MQLAEKIIEDLRDFSTIVRTYGFKPVIVPAGPNGANHVIQFLDGAGRTHAVSILAPKNGEVWADVAIATVRVLSDKIGTTGYVFERAVTRPDDVEPLKRVMPLRAEPGSSFRGKTVGVDVPERYPAVAKFVDAVEDAFRRAGQVFYPRDDDHELIVTDETVRDVLLKMDQIGSEAGAYYSVSVSESERSGTLNRVRLTRGDGLEIDNVVTGYGFVVCSMVYNGDYREFDLSDPKRYAGAIDEEIAEMIPAPAAKMSA